MSNTTRPSVANPALACCGLSCQRSPRPGLLCPFCPSPCKSHRAKTRTSSAGIVLAPVRRPALTEANQHEPTWFSARFSKITLSSPTAGVRPCAGKGPSELDIIILAPQPVTRDRRADRPSPGAADKSRRYPERNGYGFGWRRAIAPYNIRPEPAGRPLVIPALFRQ